MGKGFIAVASQTHALKGKSILMRRGIPAEVRKIPHLSQNGCGWGIYLQGDLKKAARILTLGGVEGVRIREEIG